MHVEATVTRIWEIWRSPDGPLRLQETWRTAPFSGSESAEIADRPAYAASTDGHLGWILALEP